MMRSNLSLFDDVEPVNERPSDDFELFDGEILTNVEPLDQELLDTLASSRAASDNMLSPTSHLYQDEDLWENLEISALKALTQELLFQRLWRTKRTTTNSRKLNEKKRWLLTL
mgnify:CR=1 FL=1